MMGGQAREMRELPVEPVEPWRLTIQISPCSDGDGRPGALELVSYQVRKACADDVHAADHFVVSSACWDAEGLGTHILAETEGHFLRAR